MTPAAQKMMDRLIRYPSEHGLSDLHIRSGGPMCIRGDGNILSFEDDPITEAEIVEFVNHRNTEQYQQFDETGDLDYAVQAQQFRRVNCMKTIKRHGDAFDRQRHTRDR